MLKYTGSLCLDEEYGEILNISKELVELLEGIYAQNLIHNSKSTTINDIKIIEKLKTVKTDDERNAVIKEYKLLYPHYIKKLFNRLLGDFCLYMYDSLKAIFDFKPQIAFTLARKPLIDDVFYLQYLYKNPNDCIDLVFLDNPSEKDTGVKRNREIDKQLSQEITQELGYENDIIYDLRKSDSIYSIKHNCDKSLHIATSKSAIEKTVQGELNFVFMHDEEIKHYIELYLNAIPIVLFYVVELVLKINEQLFEKIDGAQKVLKKLQETFVELLGE